MSRIPYGSELAASLTFPPEPVILRPVPRFALDTLREILEKFLQPAPLLVGEVDTVEPSGCSEGDVSRERNRVAPEVTEPTSDKDALTPEVRHLLPPILTIPLVIPVPGSQLPELAVAGRCIAIVTTLLYNWGCFAPPGTLPSEPTVRPILREGQRFIYSHRVSKLVVELFWRDPDDPVSLTSLTPNCWLTAGKRAPSVERVGRKP